jgi:phenylacetate-coenzyme A ligase PaaK-like adenylate-forming protein
MRHSDLALNGGILGRTDDMLVVRGVNVYPSAVENIVRGFDAVVSTASKFKTTAHSPN